MILFLQKIYAWLYTRFQTRRYKVNNKILWVISILSLRCLGFLIYRGFLVRGFFGSMPEGLNGEGEIAVSLTSFPARIGIVWMTIDSIMRQKLRPASVTLYLSKEEFPKEKESLPEQLKKYETLGLKIVFVDDNLMPHKKYYYSFQEGHGKCIVTVDDDLLYDDDLLQRLWNVHTDYPGSICANNGRFIGIKKNGFDSYNNWKEVISPGNYVGKELLACGYGGILYPSDFYMKYRSFICDTESIKETSLRADDLWLKAQELIAGVDVCVRSYYPHPVSIPSSAKSALSNTNRSKNHNGNDEQWSSLNNKYKLFQYIGMR